MEASSQLMEKVQETEVICEDAPLPGFLCVRY